MAIVVVVAIELLLGALLATEPRSAAAAILLCLFGISIGMAGFAGHRAAFDIDCGCFGQRPSHPLGLRNVWFAAAMLAVAVLALSEASSSEAELTPEAGLLLAALCSVVGAAARPTSQFLDSLLLRRVVARSRGSS